MRQQLSAQIEPFGDTAVLIRWQQIIDPIVNAQVRALAADLREHPLSGVLELVPSYSSLAVLLEPGFAAADELIARLRERLDQLEVSDDENARRLLTVPVCYGGPDAPDLREVSERTGLAVDEVIARHTAPEYRVAMLGFLPGFPYLMGLDPRLVVARKLTPRVRVPAGSVAIGGSQTGIYPCESPGGWQLIGRTAAVLFDARSRPPALFCPGDRVRFRPISAEELPLAKVQIQ